MTGLKNVFASKTILTTIVGAVFTLLNLAGVVNVDAATQSGIVTALFGLAGLFRYSATKQLALTAPVTEA